ARMVTVEDRAVKKGDIANIDFEGFKDGVAFDGGKGEKFDLTIGSGQFIPGFEDQLIGAKIGEEKEIEVTFPEDYQAEELKGAKATFKVKINGITVKELPALDDEFAKDNDFDTFDALKADVKAKLKKAADDRAKAEIENEVITVAAKNITADIPDCMIDTQLDAIVRDYDMRLAQQGLNVEKYLQIMGMTMEQFKEGFKDRAKEQVRVSLMLEAVAKAEKVEVTEKEI
ncbi:MAG: trigger factor, partial [Clostridia bacterium]|nr:trigger factor [Clostridia bacterium]